MESTGAVLAGFLMGIVVSIITYFTVKMFKRKYESGYGVRDKQEETPNKKDEPYEN